MQRTSAAPVLGSLLLACLIACVGGDNATAAVQAVCKQEAGGGRAWVGATEEELVSRTVMPEVQCWREPPCLHLEYLTLERCKELQNNTDWPTYATELPPPPADMKGVRDAVEDYLLGKVVVIFGDSMNDHLFKALRCDLARSGLDIDLKPQLGRDKQAVALRERVESIQRAAPFTIPCINDLVGAYVPGSTGAGAYFMQVKLYKYNATEIQILLSMSDVMVMNYGLHYHAELDNYERDMTGLFEQLEVHRDRRSPQV